MDVAGDQLKEKDTSHWKSPNAGANNNTGFTALPGEYCIPFAFQEFNVGRWWSAIEFNSVFSLHRVIDYKSNVIRDRSGKEIGASVRCVRDIIY